MDRYVIRHYCYSLGVKYISYVKFLQTSYPLTIKHVSCIEDATLLTHGVAIGLLAGVKEGRLPGYQSYEIITHPCIPIELDNEKTCLETTFEFLKL